MRWTRFKNGTTSLHAIDEDATRYARLDRGGLTITVCGRQGSLTRDEEAEILEDDNGNGISDQPQVCILCTRRLGMTSRKRANAEVVALRRELAAEREKRARLVKALHVAVVEMHPIYGSTTGPFGGIGGAAMTPWCHMIMDAPAGAGWDAQRLMVEGVLRDESLELEKLGVVWNE